LGTIATLALPPAQSRTGGEITDHELVRAVRSGDDRAFEGLYARYHRRIAAYVYGMVNDHGRAEDITQEVFISALRRMRETDRPIAFKPWVYEIAKNACIDAFRRTRRAEEVSYDADDGLGGDHGRLVHTGPTPDVAVDQKLSLDHLCGAFGGLSEAHHEILVMRELEGLSYREIGERLGMSRPSVESTLFRARRRLTEEYEELISGERCTQIQSIIAGATGGRVGTRDERRMARHVSYCQHCRRQAFMAGFDVAALSKRPVRAKIAGLLPLPAFLKRRWSGAADDRPGAAAAHHSGALAQISTAAGQYADPVMGGWAKAAAAAATIALAGVGAGVAAHGGALGIGGGSNAPATARPAATRPARAAAPAKHAPRTGGSVTATRSARSTSTTTHLPRSRAGAGSSPNASSSPGSSGTTTVGGTTAAVTTSTPAAAGGTATPILDTVQKTLTPGRPPTGGGRPGPSASGSSPSVDVPTSLTPLPKMAPLPDPAQTVTGVVDTATGSGGSGGGTLGGVTNTVGNLVGGG
jgi:RNA polymerase sigma factor (sigma-70 family)